MASQGAFDHDHPDLTQALGAVVVYKDNTSEVDYQALQRKPQVLLKYLKIIARVTPKEYGTFTPDQQKAFLINSYNAYMLQLLKDNYPVSSIQKIQVPGGPFKVRFVRLLGREFSLADLKQKLRTDFPDARLQFALTSASVGGPRLRNEAYVATRLNEQLDDQIKTFLKDPAANRLDKENKVAHISSIFNEINEDLSKAGQTITKFIAPYLTDDAELRNEFESGAYKVEYLDQNWNLNKLAKWWTNRFAEFYI